MTYVYYNFVHDFVWVIDGVGRMFSRESRAHMIPNALCYQYREFIMAESILLGEL